MWVSKEDLEKIGVQPEQTSPADAISIIKMDDGTFMIYISRKGKPITAPGRMMTDSLEATVEFLQAFFAEPAAVSTTKQPAVEAVAKQEIGFLAKAA